VLTPAGKTQAKRPLTAKELRAVRRRRRDREKRDRKEQGIRPIWSLPHGQPLRRNYILVLLLAPLVGVSFGVRVANVGLPMPGQVIIAVVVWVLLTGFVAWAFRKAFPY